VVANRVCLSELRPEHVCIIKPSSLGDVVQALPVLCALRRRFPEAKFTWVVNAAYAGLLEGHESLDHVVEFDRAALSLHRSTGRQALRSLQRRLREMRCDLTIDLQGLLRSGLLSYLTGARVRVGMGDAREGAWLFYTHTVPIEPHRTLAVDRYMAVAAALGADTTKVEFHVPVCEEATRWAAEIVGKASRPLIGMAPGARWPTKRWPADRFAALAQKLAFETGGTIVLLGTPSDAAAASRIAAAVPQRCLNLAGRTTLKQLVAAVQQLDLLVSNDSGPMHLAAALGTPVLAIFTCTLPERAAPWGKHAIIQPAIWCRGSYLKQCQRMECMQHIQPSDAAELIRTAKLGQF